MYDVILLCYDLSDSVITGQGATLPLQGGQNKKHFHRRELFFVFVAKNSTCDSGPCENGGTCVGGGDAFTCICKDGWEGPTCAQSTSLLKLLPCSHHG